MRLAPRSRAREVDENGLEAHQPRDRAAGLPAVRHPTEPALEHMGPVRAGRTLLRMGQKGGFGCTSRAWPAHGHRSIVECCEKAPRPSSGRPPR